MTTWEERFWVKVDRRGPDECWPWLAYRNAGGYGTFNRESRRPERAHRIAYEATVGPIPDGLTLDHLCRNRGCVNPAHLELVTGWENVRRGNSPVAENARHTHCPKGHSLEPPTGKVRADGRRRCRECQRLWFENYRKTPRFKAWKAAHRYRRLSPSPVADTGEAK